MSYLPLYAQLQATFNKILQQNYSNLECTFNIETAKNTDHGDFSCNIALMLAKKIKKNPMEIAEAISENIKNTTSLSLDKIIVARPGFINIFVNPKDWMNSLPAIFQNEKDFFCPNIGKNRSVYLEYVSSNPTGPLHIGHGRCGAIGSSLALLLEETGFKVHREYFINDAGRQIHILATSVWLRFLQIKKHKLLYPRKAYQGTYIHDMAVKLLQESELLSIPEPHLMPDLNPVQTDSNQDEKWLESCITLYQRLYQPKTRASFEKACVQYVLKMIQKECEDFNVNFDAWFSERSLVNDGSVEASLLALKERDHIYEKDGAIWFKAESLGDEKDRVLVKANGDYTYFATDIAYHWHKLQTQPDFVIDIMGADHHGYIPRLKAALIGLGMAPDRFNAIIYQFITLMQNQQQVQMSTRQGSYVTLQELIEQVGLDCARFYLLQKKPDQHITFDLDIAKKESLDNPIFKIHYAHARIMSILRKLPKNTIAKNHLDYLPSHHEKSIIKLLNRYPDILRACVRDHSLHYLCQYLLEVSSQLHSYYSSTKIIQEDLEILSQRHYLIVCIANILNKGLAILGLQAKETM